VEEARHGGLVGIGIGEGIDKEYFATLDELVMVAVSIHSDIVFIYGA